MDPTIVFTLALVAIGLTIDALLGIPAGFQRNTRKRRARLRRTAVEFVLICIIFGFILMLAFNGGMDATWEITR